MNGDKKISTWVRRFARHITLWGTGWILAKTGQLNVGIDGMVKQSDVKKGALRRNKGKGNGSTKDEEGVREDGQTE